MKKNISLNKIYLDLCRVTSPFAFKAYLIAISIFGPGFKSFAYTSLEKIFKSLPHLKGLHVYNTYKNLKLELTIDEAFKIGLLFYGVINANETKVLEKMLKKGDTVIDVGAYVDGWYTLFPAVLVGNSGHVYSFEPHPEFFKRLKANIFLNKLKNITLVKKGVYDKIQSVEFYVEGGCSSIVKTHAESYKKISTPKITIHTTTIDEFVNTNKIKKLNLIKIDVEGIEMNVLKGAKKTLQKMHPNLVIEVLDNQLKLGGSSKKEVLSFLKSLGYYAYSFTSIGLEPYKTNETMRTHNLYFTTSQLPQ